MAKKKSPKCPTCHKSLEEKREGEWWCSECKEWFKMLFGTAIALTALGIVTKH